MGFDLLLIRATVRAFLLRWAANPIMIIRSPMMPILLMVGFKLAYSASGQTRADGTDVAGFLVVGMLATMAWNAAIWGSGHALQSEIYAGTIGAVVVAPGRTAAVIVGYGVGSMIWELPGLAACVAIAVPFGAHFDIQHPVAAMVCLLVLYSSALMIGLAFGGLFILSRQANALSNFLQTPVWLLAGFYVSRDALPHWLREVSDVIPMAHAVDAMRATALSGASFAGVWRPLLATLGTGLIFLLAGIWSLSRMDSAVRRRATLDLL